MTKPRAKEQLITHDRATELFSYDIGLGVLRWKKITSPRVHIGDVAGGKYEAYYVIHVDGQRYLTHRLIWFLLNGEWPCPGLDHIDMNKENNRIENLRLAANGPNKCNTTLQKNNKSGVKGVHFDKSNSCWRMSVMFNKKRFHGGAFSSKEEAAAARESLAMKLHGEFYRSGASI